MLARGVGHLAKGCGRAVRVVAIAASCAVLAKPHTSADCLDLVSSLKAAMPGLVHEKPVVKGRFFVVASVTPASLLRGSPQP